MGVIKIKKQIFLFLILLLSINLVSAWDWDNTIAYSNGERTVTITNALGLGNVIAEVTILSDPSKVRYVEIGEDVTVLTFNLTNFGDPYENGFKKFKFLNMNNGIEDTEKSFSWVYAIYKEIEVLDYKTVCSDVWSEVNQTLQEECTKKIIGSHYENQIEDWKKFKTNDIPTGTFTIGIQTDVNQGDYYDGIPTFFGKEVNRWASWEASVTDAHGFNFGVPASDNLYWGAYFNSSCAEGIRIMEIGLASGVNAEVGYIYDNNNASTGNKATCTGQVCTFTNPTDLGALGTKFYIVVGDLDNSTFEQAQSGLETMPYSGTNVNWIVSVLHYPTATTQYDNYYFEIANVTSQCSLNPPIITINSPTNTTYNIPINHTINATDSIGVSTCWFSIDDGATNTSLVNDSLTIWNYTAPSIYPEGGYRADYWCNDTTAQITYVNVSFAVDTTPTIDYIEPTPVNYYNSSINSFEINMSVSELFFDNITFNLYDSSQTLINSSFFTDNTRLINYSELTEGIYQYNVTVWTNTTKSNSSATRNITFDFNSPDVEILAPTNGSEFITFTGTYNVSLNFSASDPYLDNCWYYNGTANTSISCNTNTSVVLPNGWTDIYVYSNDSAGNENSSELITILINYIIENVTYEDPVLEGDLHTFIFNISSNNIDELNGTFIYNGTSYTATPTYSDTYGELSTSIVIPQVTKLTLMNLSWDYWINSINRLTDTYNQTVNNINITLGSTCSAGLNASMCWDFKIEQNLTSINASIDYNFQLGGVSNATAVNLYGSLDNTAEFCLCINSSISNNYSLGYGEIQYSRAGYADRRFYVFNTTRLTNVRINNTLYLLDNADATSFLFDFKDTDLAPYIGKYASILRWYPDLDQYITVEMAKTDDKGETIMRVKVEDVDYRVALYQTSGALIQLLSPVRFACLSAPCSYSTIVESTERDYTSFFDVETSITYNTTSELWTYTWNDPTQNTESMSFQVVRERGDGYYTICDTSATGYTGILNCDSTGFTGTLRGIAYRTASPATAIDQKVISTISTPFKGVTGLFMSFIIFTLLMLIGIFSPVASIILGIVALVPAFYFGSITLEIFIGIAVLGGIIIHFMKRTG